MYTYVLNNPLTFTDPSGYYVEQPKRTKMPGMYVTTEACFGWEYQSRDPWFEPYSSGGGGVPTGSLFNKDWTYVETTYGSAWLNSSDIVTYDFASFYDNLSKDFNGDDFKLGLAYGYGNIWITGYSTLYETTSSFGGLNNLNYLQAVVAQ